MAAGHDHGRTSDLRQHVQHVGARQGAEGQTETDRVVAEVAPEIGLVGGTVAEMRRVGERKRGRRSDKRTPSAHRKRGAFVKHSRPTRIDARRWIAEHERADLVGVLFQKT